jgi:transcriptional regulator GlxA family with amidase domain
MLQPAQRTIEVSSHDSDSVAQQRQPAPLEPLAGGEDPVEVIARRCGFGTAETLRRAFHRHVGVAPSEYRDRFRSLKELA